jgi:NTP pyrophosphatase (non-canonical NTP hydrolase)
MKKPTKKAASRVWRRAGRAALNMEPKRTPRLQGKLRLQAANIAMAKAIDTVAETIHMLNDQWWRNPKTGRRITRNKGEMIALIHSELSEALEGVRKDKMDDHLPQWKSEEIEMADAVIRILDYCAGHGLNIGEAIMAKLFYNLERADHKPENRLKRNGKKF